MNILTPVQMFKKTLTRFTAVGLTKVSRLAARHTDVRRLYVQLLGREPESSQVVSSCVGQDIIDLATRFALSPEFTSKIRRASSNDIMEAWDFVFPDTPFEPADWLDECSRIFSFHNLPWSEALNLFEIMKHQIEDPDRTSFLLTKKGWPNLDDDCCANYPALHQDITLVIPTFNSEKWIGAFIEFYKANGLQPVFAIDSRSTDNTVSLIRSSGFRVISSYGTHNRIEALLPSIISQIATPYCIRLDDDELPTVQLISYANQIATEVKPPPIAFGRSHLFYRKDLGSLYRSHFVAWGPNTEFDCQLRFFSPANIEFNAALHSPGIHVASRICAPPNAQILHFDCVIRSEQTRRIKLREYEKQSPETAQAHRHFTVPEMIPFDWHAYTPVPSEALASFAKLVSHTSF